MKTQIYAAPAVKGLKNIKGMTDTESDAANIWQTVYNCVKGLK